MKYQVCTDDNFHYMDEEERVSGLSFETHEEAIEECKRLVEKSLLWERQQCKNPHDPDELYDRYMDFGDDPFIRPSINKMRFSAWEYAKEKSKEICKRKGAYHVPIKLKKLLLRLLNFFQLRDKPKELPKALSHLFDQALVFASNLHRTQKRKGTETPYIGHLLSVAGLVIEDGGTEEEAIAALLHDAVEDQGGAKTLEVIRKKFGEDVARIVEGCTDTDVEPKPPWRERKEKYIEHLKTASPSVKRVCLADKLHNLQTILRDYRQIGEALWERFTATKEGTLWYYRTVSRTIHESGYESPLLVELDRVLVQLEYLARQAESTPGRWESEEEKEQLDCAPEVGEFLGIK